MRFIYYLERIFLWLMIGLILHSLILFFWDTKKVKEKGALIESVVRTTQFGARLENDQAFDYTLWFPLYQRSTEVPLIVPLGPKGNGYRVGTWYDKRIGWTQKVGIRQELDFNSIFVHPTNATQKDFYGSTDEWAKLVGAPSHSLGRIAVSTRHPISPAGLLDMLSPYGVSVEWMPVYEDRMDEYPLLGISPPKNEKAHVLTERNLPASIQLFQQDIAEIRRYEKEASSWLGRELNLAEREKKLSRQSIQVYGAILTGRVEQLVKLRQLLQLHSPHVLTLQLDF